MKKVVVIGGGTVGWLTALFAQKFWANIDVTLIASSKIDILGAGEGTTPNFPTILSRLNINEEDFMEKTGCTKKYGIDFVNWRGDGKSFKHNFQNNELVYAYHFDARLVAKYLEEFSKDKNIKRIDAIIKGFNENENGINEIILDNGEIVKCDFVFDCSGFQELVIGKHFKTEWVSYADQLLCNSAIAFFLPQDNPDIQKTKTWTKGISMKNGWVWGAPLKHRWGSGYVFSDKHTTTEEVLAEAEEYFGRKLDIVKEFKFKSGTYKKFWVKNCVAVGLASSFLEPMEATSMMTSIMFLKGLLDYNFDEKYRDLYNERMFNYNEQNMLFVRHHYTCDRLDTKFWVDYKNTPLPDKLAKLYNEQGAFNFPTHNLKVKEMLAHDLNFSNFNWGSWQTIHKGKSGIYTKNLV